DFGVGALGDGEGDRGVSQVVEAEAFESDRSDGGRPRAAAEVRSPERLAVGGRADETVLWRFAGHVGGEGFGEKGGQRDRAAAGERRPPVTRSEMSPRTSACVIEASCIGPNRGSRWARMMLRSRARVELRTLNVVVDHPSTHWANVTRPSAGSSQSPRALSTATPARNRSASALR